MINTDVTIKAEFFERMISVNTLKKLLKQFNDEYYLAPNRVGNLSILKNSQTKHYIGYIDISNEIIKLEDKKD